jgi:hypothetical protein
MSELVKVEKKPSVGELLSANYVIPHVRQWNPSPFMRALGYTRNPDTCIHMRKGFTPSYGWWCKECGEAL